MYFMLSLVEQAIMKSSLVQTGVSGRRVHRLHLRWTFPNRAILTRTVSWKEEITRKKGRQLANLPPRICSKFGKYKPALNFGSFPSISFPSLSQIGPCGSTEPTTHRGKLSSHGELAPHLRWARWGGGKAWQRTAPSSILPSARRKAPVRGRLAGCGRGGRVGRGPRCRHRSRPGGSGGGGRHGATGDGDLLPPAPPHQLG